MHGSRNRFFVALFAAVLALLAHGMLSSNAAAFAENSNDSLPLWNETLPTSEAPSSTSVLATTPQTALLFGKCLTSESTAKGFVNYWEGSDGRGPSGYAANTLIFNFYLTACGQVDGIAPGEVGLCEGDTCFGLVSLSATTANFTKFELENNQRESLQACMDQPTENYPEQVEACTKNIVGCWRVGDSNGQYVSGCEISGVHPTDITVAVDMAQWRGELGIASEATSTGTPLNAGNNVPDSSAASLSRAGELPRSEWQSTFSNLRLFGSPVEEAARAGIATGSAVVLSLLVLFPTQLLNSTLEANSATFQRMLGRFRRKDRDAEATSSAHRHSRIRQALHAAPVFIAAAIITGFANPGFGFNFGSLQFVATALVSFVLLNVVGTVVVWASFGRKYGAELPTIHVRYSYLAIIAVTVLVSRLLTFEPALVFGAVIAIESGRIATHLADEIPQRSLAGRLQATSTAVFIALGLVAWIGYNLLVTASIGSGTDTSLAQEFTAGLTTEALATLPLLLLPIKFMPGAALLAWKKSAWAIAYVVATALFIFVLLPLPSSWSTISSSFATWTALIIGYAVFAVVIWATFTIAARKKHSSETD